jgi:hypothetical protein
MVWTEQVVFCDQDDCNRHVSFVACTPDRGRYLAESRGWLCAADGTDLCPEHYQARYQPVADPAPVPLEDALCTA